MAEETFTVVALPYSRSESRPFHVSLFVSPDLRPDGAEGVLGDFDHWAQWTDVLPSATVRLFNQAGELAVQTLLDDLDAGAWPAVFPPDTPVRARRAPDWDERHWRTFRAAEVHDAAKLISLFSMATSPTARPEADPRKDLVSLLMTALTGGVQGWRPTEGAGAVLGRSRQAYDESVFTRQLDQVVGEPTATNGGSQTLQEIEDRIGAATGLERAFAELHRARRFYERPEAQVTYEREPIEGAQLERPPKPEPDFHERVSLLGDHPGVLRKLGLVVDLRVDDLGALADSQFLRATLSFDGGPTSRSPETKVQVVGEDMVVPSSAQEWSAGRLRLGDEEMYRVLDMDVDGSALKTDRFLWTVPRLVEAAESTAHASTATPALRTGGFTITRTGRALQTQARMQSQKTIGSDLATGGAPRLDAEAVIQGVRLEVWDDTEKKWFSLHKRRVDVEVIDHGPVLEDVPDEGFTQGTTASETSGAEDSPVHVHEALASWGGWSLSAARPGKRVRHEDGDEIVEDTTPDPDPSTPVIITPTVENGTLPYLRYGRSYAFRGWAVDLAGNSRPHDLGPGGVVPSSVVAEITRALSTGVGAALGPASLGGPGVALDVHALARSSVSSRLVIDAEEQARRILTRDDLASMAREATVPSSGATVEADMLRPLRIRRSLSATRMGLAEPLAGVSRSSLVDRRFRDLVMSSDASPFVDVAQRVPGVIAAGMGQGESVDDAVGTITALRPFLRWEPIQPPVVVARHANSPGESLLQLVIRSGVVQDPDTLELTVTPPAEYAAANPGHRYRATSERHLAPPKTSQSEAELHGAFDFAIGSTDPTDHAAALAWIVRESGTLFDVDVPRLDDPMTRDAQPGIALVSDPGTPASTLETLPLEPGAMPAPGQYVVHDVDELSLPYLPDWLGRGIALVFPDAGRDRQLQFPFGGEGFTARYGGSWPALEPFRLVLQASSELTGNLTGRTLSVGLPAGDVQRFRLSSSMERADLGMFGFWRLLPPAFRSSDEIAEAAADGWLWVFTPYDQITLVHAVPRPLEAPRPTSLVATRQKGSADSGLAGAIDVHGPSTEQLTAEASWTEYTDDLSLPGPEESVQNGVGFVTQVRTEEDLAVLFGALGADARVEIENFGPVWLHRAVHQWGDTKHRRVTYRFRASTRFREYFHPDSLTPGEGADDGQSVIGAEREISVPSSATPEAPIIHSVLPLFRWETGPEPEQPVGTRRSRRAGIRIYLERPWYSSGEGELLGVLLAPGGNDAGIEDVVSQWGQDPVWRSTPVPNRAMAFELDDLMHVTGLDDRPEAARPVTQPVTLPYQRVVGAPAVTVVGYRPEYNSTRGLWYVDVAIDPGDRIWPFIRLAVCRYQPESLPGCELSPPVRCDFQQLLPERTASVSRTDVRHVRVVVSGAVGTRGPAAFPPDAARRHEIIRQNRFMVARLQRADPDVPTDLGWQTVDTVELIVRGTGRTPAEAAWTGELEAPGDVPVARPGDSPDWRVLIEEWELLPGDRPPGGFTIAFLPSVRRRLVYAEAMEL